jgi:undecaprenyl phosphate-alpha-L-ara4N flippase subunit ArnE
MTTYGVAVLAMILLSFGQVLLKLLAVKVADTGVNFASWQREVFSFLWLGGGIGVTYAAVLGCWLYVLKSLDLNRAFAFVALTFVFVPLCSYFILNEKITIGTVAGATLIIVGIVISANY